MNVSFAPSRPGGSVAAPPSKSMAHRYLICARCGDTVIHGVDPSEDILATMDCLRALEVGCECRDGDVHVAGWVPHCGAEGTVLPCRESGSTLRFFLPLCLMGPPITLTGSPRLLARPLEVYAALCKKQGIRFEQGETSVTVQGVLRPGEFDLPGDVSSQFVSGLLFALPALGGDSVIHLRPPVESRSYIDMTLDALRTFGLRAAWRDGRTLEIPGWQYGRPYRHPCGESVRPRIPAEVTVEGDWSNAAFFLALGPAVTVTGLREDSLQGDKICVEFFRALDGGPAELDLSDCPDLGPVLMAYAAARHGGVFTGTRRLRMKESDRGWAMYEELGKFGVPVTVEENRITVGGGLRPPSETLGGHNDHRIVMALSVLCAKTGGTLAGAEAVRKSFPDFFDRLRDCGVSLEVR